MNALSAAIERALSGRGGFRVLDAGKPSPPPPQPSFAAHRGQGVIWPLGNRPDSVWLLLRALADGVVPVLLPEDAPPARVAGLRSSSGHLGYFDGSGIQPPPAPSGLSPGIFLVVPTSGSSGEPKLVAAGEENLAVAVAAIAASQGLDDVSSTGVLLPLSHAYALVNQLFWAVLEERTLVLPGPGGWADRWGVLKGAGVGMLCMVGSQARALAALGYSGAQALPAVRVCNFAGGGFPVASCRFLRELFPGAVLLNNYGCTEAMPRLTCCEVKGPDHDIRKVGTPVGGVRIAVESGHGPGKIRFSGPSASIGFLKPDGTLEHHGEWIESGDTGFLEGDTLFVTGRHDQVVKIDGERVGLLEVEGALIQAGAEEAVVWVDEPVPGEPRILGAVFGEKVPGRPELNRAFRGRLHPAAWPALVVHLETRPLSPGGKTDRRSAAGSVRGGKGTTVWERK